MDNTAYLKEKLQHRLYDSEVLLMLASGNSLNAYKAGYWAGSEDTDEMHRCRVPSETAENVSIDDDPGPVHARRTPAGVWVPEYTTDGDMIQLIIERDSLKAECENLKRTIAALESQISQLDDYSDIKSKYKRAVDVIHIISGCVSALETNVVDSSDE